MKTTKEDFNKFKKHFEHYLKKMGVTGWSIFYRHKSVNDESYATVSFNLGSRLIIVNFADIMDKEAYKDMNLKQIAKHEAFHGLLARLSELAYMRFVTKQEIYEAEEEAVIRLEKLID